LRRQAKSHVARGPTLRVPRRGREDTKGPPGGLRGAPRAGTTRVPERPSGRLSSGRPRMTVGRLRDAPAVGPEDAPAVDPEIGLAAVGGRLGARRETGKVFPRFKGSVVSAGRLVFLGGREDPPAFLADEGGAQVCRPAGTPPPSRERRGSSPERCGPADSPSSGPYRAQSQGLGPRVVDPERPEADERRAQSAERRRARHAGRGAPSAGAP